MNERITEESKRLVLSVLRGDTRRYWTLGEVRAQANEYLPEGDALTYDEVVDAVLSLAYADDVLAYYCETEGKVRVEAASDVRRRRW
jgi:hypothetical protein